MPRKSTKSKTKLKVIKSAVKKHACYKLCLEALKESDGAMVFLKKDGIWDSFILNVEMPELIWMLTTEISYQTAPEYKEEE